MKLTLYLMLGSALMLVGILAMFFSGGASSFHFGPCGTVALAGRSR